MQETLKRALRSELFDRVGKTMAALPERYFSVHTDADIASHAEAVAELTAEAPARVAARRAGERQCSFTICTWDAPGLFSYITGILGARGFNIQKGEVFTGTNGLVVDSFTGILKGDTDPTRWFDALERELASLFVPLQASIPDAALVRSTVMEEVIKHHSVGGENGSELLLPVRIHIEDDGPYTRVSVTSQDTPFFLYSLSNALSVQGMSIRQVAIKTVDTEVQDTFWVQHNRGGTVTTEEDRRRLQLSILVTKQFSHALDQAADPRGAFARFEELVRKVAGDGSTKRIQKLLADPGTQRELARLLGASDFLWEDFIRLQYESLLPLLQQDQSRRLLSTPPAEFDTKLTAALSLASTRDERKTVLNAFKDQESYLVDIDHILRRDTDFFFLSHRLTALAEVVVRHAYRIAWDHLIRTYGTPRSAAGLPADYAVFGLGKMGGSALGYASDIELMTVYSDHGDTDGADTSITNREFFERLVCEVGELIEAKRETVFEIDLRLRPYGTDGPRAVHVESFLTYFGPGGKAHSAERLALIRMRHICGDADLGRRLIAIRDQFVYETDAVSVEEIRVLRQRQAEEKVTPGQLNAKFSPGALVDLEYNVQLLQIREGRTHRQIRNPGIHSTLRELSDLGTIDTDEAEGMIRAYRFLRNLINGLRMLRGNAQDLFLPGFETVEASHLARRMGYRDTPAHGAATQLRIDFEVETASVRSFVERHLGEEAIPELPAGNPADLVLSDRLSEERSTLMLQSAGFRNPSRGLVNIRRIADSGSVSSEREVFARLLVLAWDYLIRCGDPDMALNNWDRFTERVGDRTSFFRDLLSQPRRIEIMIAIFAGSQFLSDTLIRNPEFLERISDHRIITGRRTAREMQVEIETEMAALTERHEKLDAIRSFRRREILRIGTKDICLAGDFTDVVVELSDLARAIVGAVTDQVLQDRDSRVDDFDGDGPGRLCILAFGKLGGNELNYSSDIDLLALYEPDPSIADQEGKATTAFRRIVRDLSDFTVLGQAYRVDLRLRPWGNAGRLVYAAPTALRYYSTEAELWELQALLKLTPLAGDIDLGEQFLQDLREPFGRRIRSTGRDKILRSIRDVREKAIQQRTGLNGTDIKNGQGGIRDIEFLVQAQQMLHYSLFPQLFTGNTLRALEIMEETGIMNADAVADLTRDYLFLRRLEHFLQVYDDRQLHEIPDEPEAREKLRRVVTSTMQNGAEQGDPDRPGEDYLFTRLSKTLTRVRRYYDSVIG